MNDLANLIGANALIALLIVATAFAAMTAALWIGIQRFGPWLWRIFSRLWSAAARWFGPCAARVPMLRRLLATSLSTWRYFGLHALLSFGLALVGIVVFVELADEIGVSDELALFDQQLTLALTDQVDQQSLEMFASITHLGDRDLLLGIGAVVASYFLLRRWWLHALTWVLATGLGGVLVRVLKAHFERTRPLHDHTLTDSSGWSFPSGHAAGATLVYGMLAYLLVRHTPRVWHIPIVLIAIFMISFVGFSRVILQVHYLSDVLAGFVVATTWVALCVSGFEALRRRREMAREHAAQ
jgi:membrane-associated phospholipid phosphatase